MPISRSVATTCLISSIGKSGARSPGPIGWPVPGWSGGGGGLGRAAAMLYQARGVRSSSSRKRVRWVRTVAMTGLLSRSAPRPQPRNSGLAAEPTSQRGWALARQTIPSRPSGVAECRLELAADVVGTRAELVVEGGHRVEAGRVQEPDLELIDV